MMRLINIAVIAALVLAAVDVYKIKFESTRVAQRIVKLRMEIRRAGRDRGSALAMVQAR